MTLTYPDTQLLIANEWCDARNKKRLEVRNPASGTVIGHVAAAGIEVLERALAAARQGFEAWPEHLPHQRAAVMRRAAALIRERVERIAPLLTQEQGKPLAEARVEPLAAADVLGMEVGMLWINQPATPSPEMPFGGMKDSGYGSEGGPEAVEAYLNPKAVSISAT